MPIVTTPEDLDRLMDADTRAKEARDGLKEIKEEWDCALSVGAYRDIIEEIKQNV